jgi:hypothetical protein
LFPSTPLSWHALSACPKFDRGGGGRVQTAATERAANVAEAKDAAVAAAPVSTANATTSSGCYDGQGTGTRDESPVAWGCKAVFEEPRFAVLFYVAPVVCPPLLPTGI